MARPAQSASGVSTAGGSPRNLDPIDHLDEEVDRQVWRELTGTEARTLRKKGG